MGHHPHQLFFLLVLISPAQNCLSWGWFSCSPSENSPTQNDEASYRGSGSEFSMEALNDQKGLKLVENARGKMVGSGSCWQNAYASLFSGCSQIISEEDKRSRLAWHLSNCFQKDSGRPSFPYCDSGSAMLKCLKKLDEDERKVYLEFYLETNSICHQLQSLAFKHDTERLVNSLKKSAQFAEDKLENIEKRSEDLLQSSDQIHDSLASVDLRTQQLAQTSKNVEDHIGVVLTHSKAIYEQSKEISASQSLLQESQGKMKTKLEEGVAMLRESYDELGHEITNLRDGAVEIEKVISKVGDEMSSKMNNLQSRTNDIGNMAGISLDRQKQLLQGQSMALEGLHSLTKFQSQALEESKDNLQQFAEFSQRQQVELLQRQEQLQQAHDHLVENSKSILAAQEAFESKQASIFISLERLFALQNAILLESRLFKAFFVYSLSIFIIYMFTSTKQTYTVRPRLYIGLCATFLIEFSILRFAAFDFEQQAWVINLLRLLSMLLAATQLLHAIFTYRDYEVLNHGMLLTLVEKVNSMQRNDKEMITWDADSDVSWPSWVETELPEDVGKLGDPDYVLPEEEVGENSIAASSFTRKYDLRRRRGR